jgi:general secretion pathway protein M
MNRHLTPLQSRILALSLLLLAVVIVVGAVAWPAWRLHEHYDSHIEDYSDRLSRYRRIEALRPAIDEAIASAEKRDARQYYFKAHTPTLAAAELQGIVAKIIDGRMGRVISSQVVPVREDTKATGPTKVAMSVQLGASIVPLQMILHDLESHEPYIFIEQLTVRANQGRAYRPIAGTQAEFMVQLTVHGYMHPGEGKI